MNWNWSLSVEDRRSKKLSPVSKIRKYPFNLHKDNLCSPDSKTNTALMEAITTMIQPVCTDLISGRNFLSFRGGFICEFLNNIFLFPIHTIPFMFCWCLCQGSFAEVRVYSLGLFAVVSCLKRENYTVPVKGLSLKLPMDPRICLNYLPGSFTAPVMAQIMVRGEWFDYYPTVFLIQVC